MPSHKIVPVIMGLLLLGTGWAATPARAGVDRAPQLARHMRDAREAGERLAAGDLAGMEAALADGYHELEILLDSYHPDARTNAYLRRRGWDQLVWTQLMYRLLAVRDGLCDAELVFAERVALERVAADALANVETTVGRLRFLMEARTTLGLDAEIDRFADGLLGESVDAPDYRALVAAFGERFTHRREAVLARLETGRHRGIADPDALPAGTRYAREYQEHKARLASAARLDEILVRLAEADPGRIQALAETARTAERPADREAARNELVLQLLLVETSLDASEHDASLAEMFAYFDSWGYTAFTSCGAATDDFQEAMQLVYRARRQLARHFGPDDLRDFYTLADAAQGLGDEATGE